MLPVAFNLRNRRVLIVGGGQVAARKARTVLDAGALVRVVAPEISPDFPGEIEHLARRFQVGDCAGFSMVFAATDAREINAQIADEARQMGAWCNIADDPDGSDFHTVSQFRRGEIMVGISTGGQSPVLARRVREILESALGSEWETLLDLVEQHEIPISNRGEFWREVLNGEALALLREGKCDEARRLIENAATSKQGAPGGDETV